MTEETPFAGFTSVNEKVEKERQTKIKIEGKEEEIGKNGEKELIRTIRGLL